MLNEENTLHEEKLSEECGVFGIYSKDSLHTSKIVYYALYALQHRGQEACGIAVNNDNVITCYKALGLVNEVFDDDRLASMKGNIAVGHVRYSTTGGNTQANAQPLATQYIKGTLTIAHNGNISNAGDLRRSLIEKGVVFQTTNDTEIIANLLARARIESPSIEDAVKKIIPLLEGSYSLIIMSPRKLIAVRDPLGMRPLCMGKLGDSILFSSESCAIESVGGEFERDVKPGEIITVSPNGISNDISFTGGKTALCIFEHIYFARPDSVIDNQSVYLARQEAGRLLAKVAPVKADLVIGVPDSGVCAAMGYAMESGIPYGEGFIKNRYIGRTFIQPKQSQRVNSVTIKLNVLKQNVCGKDIVMIDDSIVRGTTMSKIVSILKKAGANKIHIRISSPEFIMPCYYGTDIPSKDELASNRYTVGELCKTLGADSLAFIPTDKICDIAKNSSVHFCDACFTGNYPTKLPCTYMDRPDDKKTTTCGCGKLQ